MYLLHYRKNIKLQRIKLLQQKRIGLFGGTFDPVHLGHTIVAEWLQFKLDLYEIHFIPNYIHPFAKRNDISTPKNRLHMLSLALADYPSFKVCQYEINKKEISYSIDTIHYFKKKYPDVKLIYLIGGDNVEEFSSWKNSDDIFKLANVVVCNRGIKTTKKTERFEFIESPLIEISSSQIRERIKNHIPYRSFLHPDVFRFIEKNKIYSSD